VRCESPDTKKESTYIVLLFLLACFPVGIEIALVNTVKIEMNSAVDKLQVMLVDEGAARTEMLVESLNNEGFEIAGRLSCRDDLIAGIGRFEPDVMVIDMESPDEMIFNQLVEVNAQRPTPVVFFADQGESGIIKKAVKAGVGAFIVDGLTARKIRPVIELSIERFKEIRSLQTELVETKNRLEERKLIEKAKGILMQRNNISEDTAYQSLRKLAMEQNKKLVDVARSTIELSELFS